MRGWEDRRDGAFAVVREMGDGLSLGMGSREEELAARPSKRVRVLGHGAPSCQVDGCDADLSRAKDYHRRHKVCEAHSKAAKALLGGEMQRFCQQCSRFHLLLEFDEGKRSCRRRLAGHNQRRRKIQPEESVSQTILLGNRHGHGLKNSEISNMLTILTRLQGNNQEKVSNTFPVSGGDQLVQILRNMDSSDIIPSASGPQVCVLSESLTINDDKRPPLTLDLLSALSSELRASNTESIAALSQASSEGRDDDSAKNTGTEPTESSDNSTVTVPPTVADQNNSPLHSSMEHVCLPDQDLGTTLQLFCHPGNESLDMQSSRHCMPVATSSKPPFSYTGSLKEQAMTNSCKGYDSPNDMSNSMEKGAGSHVIQIFPNQKELLSTVFDPYHSRHNYDFQDRTDRIIFKLFNREPSNFPLSIRREILEWLSLSPSDIESYMRPGCVILSIYMLMPSEEWDKLHAGLLPRVQMLLRGSDSNFWRCSNFLIHLNRQILSHNNGEVHLQKYDNTWSSPEVLVVSPLAIVSGKKTSLLLRGRNLRIPGTRIHCTYMDGYISKEVDNQRSLADDDSCSEQFVIPERTSGAYGRCFLEVENNLRGNTFPVIIADDNICQELRMLETELEDIENHTNLEYPGQGLRLGLREDILQFLNELGWLFQRINMQSNSLFKDFSCSRFKTILLFAVERDWSALVKKILDIVLETSFAEDKSHQYLEALREMQPLSCAVRRKNSKMVDMLLNYLIDNSRISSSRVYLFVPDINGPGGVTPLHIAASMDDSEELVDALTNDPQERGLKCWNSLLDQSGMSPYAYAQLRNHEMYNKLVERKVAQREQSQISMVVKEDGIMTQNSEESDQRSIRPIPSLSCSQCAALDGQLNRLTFHKGMVHRPYVHSLLAIATVCMCVCVFLRVTPELSTVAPFMWEVIDFGSI